jgi:putative Mn2+ efflux pump MntP
MSSSRAARFAVFFGAVAVLAIPVGVAAAAFTSKVMLLPAVYVAVPIAFVLGLLALASYRRARAQLERRVRRPGEHIVRAARLLVFAGLYFAVIGALALGFYGLLHVKD